MLTEVNMSRKVHEMYDLHIHTSDYILRNTLKTDLKIAIKIK